MSSATARSEARRKAILSRGNDRLSKLTTSARGEDHPVYSDIDNTARKAPTTETFVGEESIMPTPPPARARSAPEQPRWDDVDVRHEPIALTSEQQEFMRALINAPEVHRAGSGPSSRAISADQTSFEPGTEDDPVSAMLKALTQMSGQLPPGAQSMNMPGIASQATEAGPRSLFSKILPLLHIFATWILLVFFTFLVEPKAYDSIPGAHTANTWERWTELAKRSAKAPFGVQPVPFFWAFVTLQLMLHSIQILTKSNPIQPPTLLALALPSLSPPLRSLITNFLAYARMGGMLLDDIAGLIVGIAILIWISSWLSGSR